MNAVTSPIEVEITKHIIYVQDVNRAVQFYHDVLGFHTGLQKADWCEMHHGGSIVGLRGGQNMISGKTGLAIQVPNIHSACDHIAASGGRIIEAPKRYNDAGIHLGIVADTEGNEIMITQIIE